MEALSGFSVVVLVFLLAIPLALQIFLTVFVYKDAEKREMDSALAWAMLVFLTSLVGVLIYVLCRKEMGFHICPICGKQLLPQWTSCPFCAPRRRTVSPASIRKGAEPAAQAGRPSHVGTRRLEVQDGLLAFLIIRQGKRRGKEFRLKADSTKIGSAAGNDVIIEDDTVSAEHAKIKMEEDGFMLWDLGSTNGTKVNGEIIREPRKIIDGDIIELGETSLAFKTVE
ncbi:MAG: FHA domain-containing protein [Candidatus Abyssobacteria bacterium SURF_17]|uniref:FHA domain-containing protein n=1 Tax=Candidatus Abyssobacteria bacterium SURF_17 TaxID=2093361 RepID=A0A419EQB3_9BACT|nr:MAG: FHA domain-containing protein [Candidatus Abyssubacteria bacterium SURF_17]